MSILSAYSYAKIFILVGPLWGPSPLDLYKLIKAGIDGDSAFFMVLPNVFVIEVLKINICHNL